MGTAYMRKNNGWRIFVFDALGFLCYTFFKFLGLYCSITFEAEENVMFTDIRTSNGDVKAGLLLQPFLSAKNMSQTAEIKPDVCLSVLEATNNPIHIRDMLQCVAQLPASKIKEFQNVILATFTNREQPNDIVVLGKKLAVAGKFERAFNQALKPHDGDYLMSAEEKIKKYALTLAEIDGKELPQERNLLFLAKHTCLREVPHLSGELDFSKCSYASLQYCDLKAVENVLLPKDGAVNFTGSKNLPKNLDVSKCADVVLEGCDLAKLANLHFADGAAVDLLMAQNLPEDLDVSSCAKVDMSYCDLSKLKELTFRDNALVYMQHVKQMPPKLDLSKVKMADMAGCDFEHVVSVTWAHDMVLFLDEAKKLPDKLDFSKCSTVSLRNTDMSRVKEVVFKNKEQMRKSHWKPQRNWSGNLRFEHEDTPQKTSFLQKVKSFWGR